MAKPQRHSRYALCLLTFTAVCMPIHASTWQVCNMELRITDVLKNPYPQLRAQVLKVIPTSLTAECPDAGAILTFTPETTDYQRQLPRRQWPNKGQSVRLNYRYLDGVCKGDGHSYECRIKHYPLVAP